MIFIELLDLVGIVLLTSFSWIFSIRSSFWILRFRSWTMSASSSTVNLDHLKFYLHKVDSDRILEFSVNYIFYFHLHCFLQLLLVLLLFWVAWRLVKVYAFEINLAFVDIAPLSDVILLSGLSTDLRYLIECLYFRNLRYFLLRKHGTIFLKRLPTCLPL